jgi:hypothetical protein
MKHTTRFTRRHTKHRVPSLPCKTPHTEVTSRNTCHGDAPPHIQVNDDDDDDDDGDDDDTPNVFIGQQHRQLRQPVVSCPLYQTLTSSFTTVSIPTPLEPLTSSRQPHCQPTTFKTTPLPSQSTPIHGIVGITPV